uniref:Uncharacterized protein n=1 Tax=Clytia hemisphaerica TaxID=252671 RepID=A0A7M5XMG8_9CNID
MNKTVTKYFTEGRIAFEGKLRKPTSSNRENGTSIVLFSNEFGAQSFLTNQTSGLSLSRNRGNMGSQEMIGFCIGTIFGSIVLIAVFYYLCKEYCWKRYFRKLTIKKEKLYELESSSEETQTLGNNPDSLKNGLKTPATNTEDDEVLLELVTIKLKGNQRIENTES